MYIDCFYYAGILAAPFAVVGIPSLEALALPKPVPVKTPVLVLVGSGGLGNAAGADTRLAAGEVAVCLEKEGEEEREGGRKEGDLKS